MSRIESTQSAPARGWAISYQWPVLGALFFTMFVALGSWHTFGVFFKHLAGDLGGSRGLVSGILSVTWVVYGGTAILTGAIMDRHGPRTLITIGGIVVGLAYVLASRVSSSWQLYLVFGSLLGIGLPVFWVIPAALVSKWFQKKRGLVLGLLLSAGGAAQIFMPPLASLLIAQYGWRTAYIILAAMIWAAVVPLVLLLRRVPQDWRPTSDPIEERPSRHEQRGSVRLASAPLWSAVAAARTRSFWLLFAIWFLFPISQQTMVVHLIPYATDAGIEPMAAATIISVLGLATVTGRIMIGSVSDHIGSRLAFGMCLLVTASGVFALLWSKDLWVLYVLAAVVGLGLGGESPVFVKIVVELFGPSASGQVLGLMSCGWALGSALAVWTVGHIFDVTGSYSAAFMIGGALVLLALALVPFLRTPQTAGVPDERPNNGKSKAYTKL